MLERVATGFLLAAIIATAARRARSLSGPGAVAAIIIGAAAVAAGWAWGALLVLYFVSSSALSRFRRDEKQAITAGVVAKGGERDAKQVFANGGIFAACLVLAAAESGPFAATMAVAAVGALAASAADTWATEIGTLFGGTPRSLLTRKPLPPGTSGAVSFAGTIGMIAGAACVAAVAMWLGLPGNFHMTTIAGIAGAVADSLLGATVQERRWCATCELFSEQRTHECGSPTTRTSGRDWIDNDLVNLLSTFVGASVAAALATI